MRGEGVRQAERRRELRAKQARTENPDRHVETGTGHRADNLSFFGRAEIVEQFHHVLREAVGSGKIAAQRPRGFLVRARCPAESEVDAIGEEGFQRTELLGHHERRMVRQHDAAGADADGRGSTRDMSDDDSRGRAGNARNVVVFGQPEALVAPALGVARQIEAVDEGLGGGATGGDRREIENGESSHHGPIWVGPDAAARAPRIFPGMTKMLPILSIVCSSFLFRERPSCGKAG